MRSKVVEVEMDLENGEKKDKVEETARTCRGEREVRRKKVQHNPDLRQGGSKVFPLEVSLSDKVGDVVKRIPSSACDSKRDV